MMQEAVYVRNCYAIKSDNKWNFENYFAHIWSFYSRKIDALVRVFPYMNLPKTCIIMNAFFNS